MGTPNSITPPIPAAAASTAALRRLSRLCWTTPGIEEIARGKGVEIHLEKVEEIRQIMAFNVLATPGVVLDGQVVHAGGVPSRSKMFEGLMS